MKYKLGDIVEIEKKTVNPQRTPNEHYFVYSLPGFDSGKTPERLTGSKILSNKIIIDRNNYILFNKLNLKFKRVWRFENDGRNNICSTEFLPLYIVKKDKANLDYLYYYLINNSFYMCLTSQNSGTSNSHQRIHKEDLLSMEIDLPDLETQKKIVRILSALDQKIELNDKQSKSLIELNRRIFLDLYKKESDNWQQCTINDVFSVNMRGISPKYVASGIPVINQRCIRDNVIQEEAIQYHDPDVKCDDNYLYQPYDILINSMGTGTLGRISQIGGLGKEYLIHSCISILRTRNGYSQLFFGEYIKLMQDIIEKMGSGSTGQTSLSNKELGKVILKVPSREIQEKYGLLFKTNIDKMTENILQNKVLEAVRDALLPKLMSGEINLEKITT